MVCPWVQFITFIKYNGCAGENMVIRSFQKLQSLVIGKGCLTRIASLEIASVPQLQSVVIEDEGCQFGSNLILNGIITTFMNYVDLEKLSSITIGKKCFEKRKDGMLIMESNMIVVKKTKS